MAAMGNEIPWSQIHPSIQTDAPFVGVVIIDPDRRLCISELIPLDPQVLDHPDVAASETIAAAQQAAARVASAYRQRRKQPEPSLQARKRPGPARRPRRQRLLSLDECDRLEAQFGRRSELQPAFRVLTGGVDRSG